MTDSQQTLLVLGGTSDIGRATALAFAEIGWALQLAGRDEKALGGEAADIATRTGVPATCHRFDVLDTASFPAFVDALSVLPDAVICVVGLLGDQARAQSDIGHAVTVMRSNYEGPALILGLLAERFMARGSGIIIGISSVAGDRGRASNYVYGSAKAGFTAFLSGLRNRFTKAGIHVLTVKPGFVRTRMTEGLKLPSVLTSRPEEVAAAILGAVRNRHHVLYCGPAWRLVMSIICMIPESIFKKLSI